MTILHVVIPHRMSGQRLDSAISEMLPHHSRSKITSMIKSGDALISEEVFKPKDKSNGNETVTLKLRHKEKTNWIPQKISLDVIYEDSDIIIINKPFGLVTHPGAGNWTGTLANALLEYEPELSNLDNG